MPRLTLDDKTAIGVAPNVIANCEQDNENASTVPFGIGISKTFQFGEVPDEDLRTIYAVAKEMGLDVKVHRPWW